MENVNKYLIIKKPLIVVKIIGRDESNSLYQVEWIYTKKYEYLKGPPFANSISLFCLVMNFQRVPPFARLMFFCA